MDTFSARPTSLVWNVIGREADVINRDDDDDNDSGGNATAGELDNFLRVVVVETVSVVVLERPVNQECYVFACKYTGLSLIHISEPTRPY